MNIEPPRKEKFIGVETKMDTYQIQGQFQLNHPRIINVNNTNTSPDPSNPQPENKKENPYIPYSCIPLYERYDYSYDNKFA